MFRAVGSFSRLHFTHARRGRRYDRIFDIHFRLRDTADFVSPYITMGNPQ